NNLTLPAKQTISDLYKIVRKDLGLEPTNIGDQDIIQILSGFTSTVAGIGALRTHKSSAHGHGRNSYCLEGRHARLASISPLPERTNAASFWGDQANSMT